MCLYGFLLNGSGLAPDLNYGPIQITPDVGEADALHSRGKVNGLP